MLDLDARREDRKKREEERLKSPDVIDPRPSDHGGEAQDDATGVNLGDGTGDYANAGANGALASREEGTAGSASWPSGTAKAPVAAPKASTAKKDPTA